MAATSLLRKLGLEAVHQVLPCLLTAITANPQEALPLRLRLLGALCFLYLCPLCSLTNTYNILDGNASDRYQIFLHILNFAETTQRSHLLLPHFKNIDKRIVEWGLEQSQIRELYKKAASLHRLANHRFFRSSHLTDLFPKFGIPQVDGKMSFHFGSHQRGCKRGSSESYL